MKINRSCFVIFISFMPLFVFSQNSLHLQRLKEFAIKNMPKFYDSTLHYINLKPRGDLNYLYPFYQLFKEEIKFRQIENDNGYFDEMSKAASFVDDYQSALEYQIKTYDSLDQISDKQVYKTVNQLKELENANAVKYISYVAKSYQVIMINEAENKPLHRAFTFSLLEELYKKGFHYLAMETLNNFSNHSTERLTDKTGYFTNEPVAGELVRRALELGYTLVPYDDTVPAHDANERNAVQAENIYKIILRDSSAKILVHGSYGHVAKKSSDNNYVPMGMAFKKISGIDPYCIDQVSMCDESEFSYGQSLYRAYTEKFAISVPSIPMSNGQAINVTNDSGFDACVVHPHTIYKDGRPIWLSLGGLRHPTYIKPTVANTFLVQAYYENETKLNGPGQLVPADQSYISLDRGSYLLYLRTGKYLIVFRDIAYHLIGKLNIEVN